VKGGEERKDREERGEEDIYRKYRKRERKRSFKVRGEI